MVAAKLKRDLKQSELQLKKRPLARKQRDQLGNGHEVAKPRLHRNDHKNNQFGLIVSVNSTANQSDVSAFVVTTLVDGFLRDPRFVPL